MQSNEDNYKGEEREEIKEKKNLSTKKELGKRSFIYDIRNIHKHPIFV